MSRTPTILTAARLQGALVIWLGGNREGKLEAQRMQDPFSILSHWSLMGGGKQHQPCTSSSGSHSITRVTKSGQWVLLWSPSWASWLAAGCPPLLSRASSFFPLPVSPLPLPVAISSPPSAATTYAPITDTSSSFPLCVAAFLCCHHSHPPSHLKSWSTSCCWNWYVYMAYKHCFFGLDMCVF